MGIFKNKKQLKVKKETPSQEIKRGRKPKNKERKPRPQKRTSTKRASAKVVEDDKIIKNYVVLRKELISGYMRIEDLDFVGKIKLALRYRDEKSGKEAERQRKQELKEVRLENSKYNKLHLSLRELCAPLIEGESYERHVKLDARYRTVIDKVVQLSDFNGLSFEMPPYNPNLLKYMKDVPILLIIKREGDGNVI